METLLYRGALRSMPSTADTVSLLVAAPVIALPKEAPAHVSCDFGKPSPPGSRNTTAPSACADCLATGCRTNRGGHELRWAESGGGESASPCTA
jgi:hypothetical protein